MDNFFVHQGQSELNADGSIADVHIPLVEDEQPVNNNTWWRRARITAEAGLVAFEISPISTALQIGVLISAQAATHNPAISVGAFAGLTLGLEATSVIAITDVLDTKAAEKSANAFNRFLGRIGLSKLSNHKTGTATDLSTTLLVGTPVALILKQRQSPERTAAENRRYGLKLCIGATAIWSAGAGAIIENVVHSDDYKTIAIAAGILLGAGTAAYKWVKNRFARNP